MNRSDEEALQEQIEKLTTVSTVLTEALSSAIGTIRQLQSQSNATMYALAIVMREFRDRKQLDVADLANDVESYTREHLGEDPERDQLLRDILVGGVPVVPASLPKLTLIQGGKDDPPPNTPA